MKRTREPNVVISSTQGALRVPRRKIERLVAFCARAEGVRVADVDLAVVTSRQIAAMNRRWLGHRGATDVICFDLSDASSPDVSAQLIVCAEVAVAEARRRGIGPQRELLLYVTHGLLHLMDYNDTTPPAAASMASRQEELLADFLARDRRR